MTSNKGNSKEEEFAAIMRPSDSANQNSLNGEEPLSIESEDTTRKMARSSSAKDISEQHPVSKQANDTDSNAIAISRSITGLELPRFVHLLPNETQIAKDSPAEDPPEGWYHFDNGCRSGNRKVPHRDTEYERQLQKHTKWNSDNQEISLVHRAKAMLEKDAYDKCFLVYRAHLARTLDVSEWNRENIKECSAYEPDWPWALLPHPSEGWGAGYHEPSRSCPICEDYSR